MWLKIWLPLLRWYEQSLLKIKGWLTALQLEPKHIVREDVIGDYLVRLTTCVSIQVQSKMK
jgi:hypothetical protein